MALPFTQEELQQVYNTNVKEFVLNQGFEFKDTDLTKKACRVKDMSGLYIFDRGFHHFGSDTKGNITDFAKVFLNLDFNEAVETILGTRAYSNTIEFTPKIQEPKEEMILPKIDSSIKETAEYLIKNRCLSRNIVKELVQQGAIQQVNTENKGMVFKNCAFISFGEDNKPKYCSLRALGNSKFRQDVQGSDKSYGFKIEGNPQSNRVWVFESPIDLISHATLYELNNQDYKQDTRISMGGLSDKALLKYLDDNKNIKEIVFCFDNDSDSEINRGQVYAKSCFKKMKERGYTTFINRPYSKDFNQDLQNFTKEAKQIGKSIDREIGNAKKKIEKINQNSNSISNEQKNNRYDSR